MPRSGSTQAAVHEPSVRNGRTRRHRFGRRITEREPAHLGTLSSTVTVRRPQIDVADVEPAALAHAQSGAVEELEHREVAPRDGGRRARVDGFDRRGRRRRGRPRRSASRLRRRGTRGNFLAALRRAEVHGDIVGQRHPRGAGSGRTRAPPPRSGRSSAARSHASGGTRSSAATRCGRARRGPGIRRARTSATNSRRRAVRAARVRTERRQRGDEGRPVRPHRGHGSVPSLMLRERSAGIAGNGSCHSPVVTFMHTGVGRGHAFLRPLSFLECITHVMRPWLRGGFIVLAFVRSATLHGVDGQVVNVEVHVSRGLPGYTVVGLPDAAGPRVP